MDDVLHRIIKGPRVNAPDDLPPFGPDDKVSHLRVPPHSVESEQALLGALIIDSTLFGKVSDIVTGADFYNHQHQLILRAIEALVVEGATVDIVSVFEKLERDGKAQESGGLTHLNALAQSVPNLNGVQRYAETIRERATLRRIIAKADEIATRAFSSQPSTILLDDMRGSLSNLARERNVGTGRLPLLTLDQLGERAVSARWLVKNLIPAESVGMLFGGSGTFKSFVAFDAAGHVANGLPWLGRRTKQGEVLYIAAEGGTGLFWRGDAWHRARHLQRRDSPLRVIPVAMDLRADAWRVVEAAQVAGIKPVFVVVDTMSQTFSGNENDASEVASYLRQIGIHFRDTWGCAVMLVHHTGHLETDRPRGSAAIQANTDYLYGIARDQKEMLATMNCLHRKDGESFDDVIFQLTKLELGKDQDGDPITSLVARHLTAAEDVQEALEAESKAGRGGNNQLFLRLMQNGQLESELRSVFYRECGLGSAEARKKAYQRARAWAIGAGFLDIAEGYVLTLRAGTKQ